MISVRFCLDIELCPWKRIQSKKASPSTSAQNPGCMWCAEQTVLDHQTYFDEVRLRHHWKNLCLAEGARWPCTNIWEEVRTSCD
jgi:hypothetical protein